MADEMTLDPWTYFDYKPTFPDARGIKGNLAPSWVGDHFRRISAYNLIEAYYRNAARWWLDVTTVDQEDIDKRREYGDPYVIVQQVVASVIGEEQNLVVAGALGPGPTTPAAVTQQETLQQWMVDERFLLKMIEAERNAAKLGDAVYVIYDDPDEPRPHLRTYNPGVYFPVLDEEDRNGWPRKIHIAWEFEKLDANLQKRRYVTRSTWELRDLPGEEVRNHPWNDEPSTVNCWYSKGTWRIDQVRQIDQVDLFTPENATWEVEDEDLDIDYIPVVHLPNTVAEEEHYGVSIFANVMQIFDDLISSDTDLQASSATTGSPPIAVSGASLPTDDQGRVSSYGPGTVWQTGDGNATMIDTSTSLDALLKYVDSLIKRLSINIRLPESLMGRIKPSEVPSGITLALSFTPHASDIREKRLVRRDKYGLLYKFISRSYMKRGELDDIFPVELQFGSFLPSHKKEIVDLIVQCRSAKPPVISLETAVRMLVEAGFPIEDAVEEVRRIEQNDFEGANELLNAVGEPNPSRARLGLPPLPEPPPLDEEDFDLGGGGGEPAVP